MGPAFSFVESITSQDHPAKGTSADMELRNYPKPKHYLHNYQTDTAIFLATKHKKTIMACSLFKFFQLYRKYIKTVKNGGFCKELLNENDFEAVLVNFCCYDEYIIVPMFLRQFRSED